MSILKTALFLGLFVIASVVTAHESMAASGLCDINADPKITVNKIKNDVQLYHNKTRQELASITNTDHTPYPAYRHTYIGGLMTGYLTMDHQVVFETNIDEKTATGCASISKLEINLNVSPTIYVASDFNDYHCWYKEILKHEIKHVDVDVKIMNDYEDRIKDAMMLLFSIESDRITGRIGLERLPQERKELATMVENALAVVFKGMMLDRNARQRAVDNIHEYNYVNGQCEAPKAFKDELENEKQGLASSKL